MNGFAEVFERQREIIMHRPQTPPNPNRQNQQTRRTIELINLTLNEIRRSAQMVADVENDYRRLIFNIEKLCSVLFEIIPYSALHLL